jgi:hypothetical protein
MMAEKIDNGHNNININKLSGLIVNIDIGTIRGLNLSCAQSSAVDLILTSPSASTSASTSRSPEMDIDFSINRPTDANDQAVIQRRPCRNFFENIMNILTNWIKINKHHLFSRRDQTNQLCEQTRPTSRQVSIKVSFNLSH